MASGTPVHEMWLRLTVDDELVIRDVEAVTDHSPFPICRGITGNFARLKGLSIRPGFHAKVKELLGGVEGCTHLVEMLGPVATTAFQTIYPYRDGCGASAASPPRRGRARSAPDRHLPRLVEQAGRGQAALPGLLQRRLKLSARSVLQRGAVAGAAMAVLGRGGLEIAQQIDADRRGQARFGVRIRAISVTICAQAGMLAPAHLVRAPPTSPARAGRWCGDRDRDVAVDEGRVWVVLHRLRSPTDSPNGRSFRKCSRFRLKMQLIHDNCSNITIDGCSAGLQANRRRFFARGQGDELEGMDRAGHLLGQEGIDRALALEPALAGEGAATISTRKWVSPPGRAPAWP